MAYFDNASTSYPKPDVVYSFMDSFYKNYGGNAGRGNYKLASISKDIIDETRELIGELLQCGSKQVIFTPTATIALNMIIQGIILDGVKNVYITPFEHNAVTRTLYHFEKNGLINVIKLAVTNTLEYDLNKIRYQFDAHSPDFVIASHASNVIGLLTPIENVFKLAKDYKSITLVDMAQTAGLVNLNVGLEAIDFAVFAGHKTLFGPTGISGFIMKPNINLPVLLYGGTGYNSASRDMPENLPERYETGTLNTLSIAGLNAALKWIKTKTIKQIYKEEKLLRLKLISLIKDFNFLKIVGDFENNEYIGIVSCLFDGISSDSAGNIFAERGISIRSGLQCAPMAHQFLNTYPAGTLRFSVNALTNNEDFAELYEALTDIKNNL